MKLRNKKTGELVTLTLSNDGETFILMNERTYIHSVKLKDLEEWEDMPEEERHDFYYINENGGVLGYVPYDPDGEDLSYMKYQKEIGNHFKTKEEAEQAVEKLKAWKRLRDRGFKFKDWKTDVSLKNAGVVETTFNLWDNLDPETVADLDLLFNQEDD